MFCAVCKIWFLSYITTSPALHFIFSIEKARNRRMDIPKDFEPIIDYGAVPEPLLYAENEDMGGGGKIRDALDSNEPSDVEVYDDREAFGYVDEFNPFGAT